MMARRKIHTRKTKFGKITFYSHGKGAFVEEISEDPDESFVSNDLLEGLEIEGWVLNKGQVVQYEIEDKEVKTIKPIE